MSRWIREMGVRDRTLITIKGEERPYCILRVLKLREDVVNRSVVLWLSLMKREAVIKVGETLTLDLNRVEFTVTLRSFRNQRASLAFQGPPEVQFKPLKKRGTPQ